MKTRMLVLTAVLVALMATPALAATPTQGTPTLPDNLDSVAAWMFLATLILPPLCSLVKRYTPEWTKEKQSGAILVLCLLVAAVQAYLNGSLQWANGDTRAFIGLLVVNIAVVVDLAYSFWYKMVWQALGLDSRIAGTG